MNSFLKFVYRRVIGFVLRRPCPIPIPRSGEEGEQVNCYSVALTSGDKPFLLIKKLTNTGVEGWKWSAEDQQYKIPAEVSFAEIKNYDITIIHYYGLMNVKFKGVFDFIVKSIFRWPYLKIWWDGVEQAVYNRRKLVRAGRIEILELMKDMHIENGGKPISSFDVMNELHSRRWFGHPQGDIEHTRLQLFLDSLVETGDLAKDRTYFNVKGIALKTISDFSLEEERHNQSVSLQRAMKWLTWLLVLSAILTVIATVMTVTEDSLLWKKYKEFDSESSLNKSLEGEALRSKKYHRPESEAEKALDKILSRNLDERNWDIYGFVFNYSDSRAKQGKELSQLFTKAFLDKSEREEKALIAASCGGHYPENGQPCDMIRSVNPIACAQDTPDIYLYRTVSSEGNAATIAYTWNGTEDGPTYQMIKEGLQWKLNATSCDGVLP